jgi:putative sporulation protein YyaC
VIAVDASVGAPDYVGHIGMGSEPIKPGSGLGKTLPPVGDIAITGIAAAGGLAPFLMLQNASLGLIYNMAEKTFFAIQSALYRMRLEKRLPPRKIVQPVQSARA